MTLTRREQEVAMLWRRGLPAAVIAARLRLAPATVRTTAYRVRRKGFDLDHRTARRGDAVSTLDLLQTIAEADEPPTARELVQDLGMSLHGVRQATLRLRREGLLTAREWRKRDSHRSGSVPLCYELTDAGRAHLARGES